MGDHIKIIFDYFQIKKWMLQTVSAGKVEVEAIYIYASKSFHYTLSEMLWFIEVWDHDMFMRY